MSTPSRDAPSKATPARIGKYEILGPLAIGGMAELFLARAGGVADIERLVVIKRVLPQLARSQKFVDMFVDEMRLSAELQHPNIVQVYDFGRDEGGHYVVMEYLHGENLAQVMKAARDRRLPLPLEHAITVVLGMCAGLHHAHEHVALDGMPLHIVHRDVSPHNVAITYDGSVKVVDFGIAKAARRLRQTLHGTIKGKLAYMSPEQGLGEAVDRRSDVFSISIVLWELTTGERLFADPSPIRLLEQVTGAIVPSPSSLGRSYPADLEAIVMKGLRRRPHDRFQTAEDLQAALETFVREHKLPASPIGLARYMRQLFPPAVDAWRAAQSGAAVTSYVLGELKRRRDQPGRDDELTAFSDEYDGALTDLGGAPDDEQPLRDTEPIALSPERATGVYSPTLARPQRGDEPTPLDVRDETVTSELPGFWRRLWRALVRRR